MKPHQFHLIRLVSWLGLNFIMTQWVTWTGSEVSIGVYAQSLDRSMSLAEPVDRVGYILAGRCVEVRRGPHPDYPNIRVTYVMLEVSETKRTASTDSICRC